MQKPKNYRRKKGNKQFNPFRHERISRQKLYDGRWANYRFRFLKANPFCYLCSEKATVVDHIVPHKGNRDMFVNLHNHMPLCRTHHNIITGRFDHKEGLTKEETEKNLKAKAKYIAEERSLFGIGRKVKVLKEYDKKRGGGS